MQAARRQRGEAGAQISASRVVLLVWGRRGQAVTPGPRGQRPSCLFLSSLAPRARAQAREKKPSETHGKHKMEAKRGWTA